MVKHREKWKANISRAIYDFGNLTEGFYSNIIELFHYKKMFPNGFKEFVKDYKSGAPIERDCMLHTKNFNYNSVGFGGLPNQQTKHFS